MDSSFLEQLEKEITCAICQEHYMEPKILPCLHYYCKRCILKLSLRTASNEPFLCPVCREETTIPQGGVENLKTAFFVNGFQANFLMLQKVYGKVEFVCEECSSSDKAQAFCRHCAVFICKECEMQHKRMKCFTSHEVVSLDDLQKGTAKEISARESMMKTCSVHEEPLILYCFDCNILICRDCTLTVHKHHKFEFSKVVGPDAKKELLENLCPLKNAAQALSGAVEDVVTTKLAVEAQAIDIVGNIQDSFSQLELILNQCKQRVLRDVTCLVQKKADKLSGQEKDLRSGKAEVESVIDYTEKFVGNCSSNEIMSMKTDIRRRIDEIEKLYTSKYEWNLDPVEEADIGVEVKCAEDLQSLCETKIKIVQRWDPTKFTVRRDEITAVEVHKIAKVTVTTTQSKSKIDGCDDVVLVSKLKSLTDGTHSICDVEQIKHGEYNIQCKPSIRGRHELTVSLSSGEPLSGSPFSILVSAPPTKLGKPVQVWSGIHNPSGITVSSEGDIFVCEWFGDIIKLDAEGNKHVMVDYSRANLSRLSDIAADEECLYCTGNTNEVLQIDLSGKNIARYKVQQDSGPGHRGVAIIRQEVMLCECNNKGTIMVYNRKLKYVRRIVYKDAREFSALSADTQNNVYVTDYTSSMVHVFRNDGILLRSFGCDSSNVKWLMKPWGLCVSGQYVYVTNYYSHSVSIFTAAGDVVTSFGQHGHEEGMLEGPSGICVDANSFVYVLDYNNHRVQCF